MNEMTQENKLNMIAACHFTILLSIDAFDSLRLHLREYLLTVDVAEDILVTYKSNSTEMNNFHVFCFEAKVGSSANGILQTRQRRRITPVAVVPKGRLATADVYRAQRAN